MSWKKKYYEKKSAEQNELDSELSQEEKEVYNKYVNINFFSEISEGFKLFFRGFYKIIPIILIITLIWTTIGFFIFLELDWTLIEQYWDFWAKFNVYPGDPLPSMEGIPLTDEDRLFIITYQQNQLIYGAIENYFYFIPFMLSFLLIAYYLKEKIKGNNVSLKESFQKGFQLDNLKTTLFIIIMISALISFGISFLVIPGLLFLMLLGFVFFEHTEKKTGLSDLMRNSFNRSEGLRLRTFMLILLSYIIMLFFSNYMYRGLMFIFFPDIFNASLDTETYNLVTYNLLNPATRELGILLTMKLFYFLTQAIFLPLMYCFLAVQYTQMESREKVSDEYKIKKQNIEREQIQKEEIKKLKRKGKDHIAKVITHEGKEPRYYCPNCGKRVIVASKKQTTVRCDSCNFEVHIPKYVK